MGFFGDLFGKGQRKDIEKGKKAGINEIEKGYGAGRDEREGYYRDGRDMLDPYIDRGNRAGDKYGDALGINGRDAQQGYYDNFMTDPGYDDALNAGLDAAGKNAGARGMSFSGRALKELGTFGQRFRMEAHDKRLSQLSGLNTLGAQTAATGAGFANATGKDLNDSWMNEAGNKANLHFQAGAAKANTRFGLGDLAGVIAAGAKAYAASDIRLKRDIERLGELPSGLPVYRFRYLWSDAEHVGVMAQEAQQLFPDAVATIGGFLHVDYSAIG